MIGLNIPAASQFQFMNLAVNKMSVALVTMCPPGYRQRRLGYAHKAVLAVNIAANGIIDTVHN